VELAPFSDTRNRLGVEPPRPLRSAVPLALVGVLPLGLGLAAVIRPLSGFVFAAIFLAAGVLQWSLAHSELSGMRRRADLELRLEPQPQFLTSLAQWRACELTSDRHRLALARSMARTERDLSPALLPGASPLNRVAARPHRELFHRLVERLASLDHPVTPQSVLQVEQLLTSPDSPLYARERAGDLRAGLRGCLQALDALPGEAAADAGLDTRPDSIPGSRDVKRVLAGQTRLPGAASLEVAQSRIRRLAVGHRRSEH
jgi:hypothetical protein